MLGLSCSTRVQQVGSSSLTRDQPRPPALGTGSLSHWTTNKGSPSNKYLYQKLKGPLSQIVFTEGSCPGHVIKGALGCDSGEDVGGWRGAGAAGCEGSPPLQSPSLAPAIPEGVPGRDEQGRLELGVRWEAMVVDEERVREAASGWEQGGKWSGRSEHPPGFPGEGSVQDKCFPPRY